MSSEAAKTHCHRAGGCIRAFDDETCGDEGQCSILLDIAAATPSPASGELASLVEKLNKGADSASWTEALDLLRLAASQLAAVAAERDALAKDLAAWRQAWEDDGRDVRYFSKCMTAQQRAITAERLLAEARGALTQIASGRDKDGNTVDFFQDIAGEALVTLSPGGSNGQR